MMYDEREELLENGLDEVEGITFSEDNVRLVEMDGVFMMSESDLDAVMEHYGILDMEVEETLELIAESHNLDVETLGVILDEDATTERLKRLKIRKLRAKNPQEKARITKQMSDLRYKRAMKNTKKKTAKPKVAPKAKPKIKK